MGKKRREEMQKKSTWKTWNEQRKDAKELKMIRSEEEFIYRVKLDCMKQDN